MMFIISIIVVLVHLETLSQHFFRHFIPTFLNVFFGQIDCNRGTSGTVENRRTSPLVPSGNLTICDIENGHRNSEFSH